ncbi:GNAT family N-acetyltransferase [uncultured Faecalibaculum sp.]|uniref:GNAT family N-acetyltransferase n=1 Tax=uncultured Faecalibaculum sp. TaxID=1729681 RepID=UPI002675C339|nr:GNAT family N-acetyltransferase [uncultured Faecalibaculum sp.]
MEYRFEPERQRSAVYDAGTCIGECHYSAGSGAWIIDHTEVDPAYGGRSIARRLVEMVAQEAQARGIQVIPLCSYAVKVLS